MKILFLDDEYPILESLKYAFMPTPYECRYIQYPLEAMELLRTEHYDILITDYNMPKLNGIDILKNVKNEGIKTEVIIITGFADVNNAIDAVNYGAYGFFRKPLNINELLKTVMQFEKQKNLDITKKVDTKKLQEEYRKLKRTYNELKRSLPQKKGETK